MFLIFYGAQFGAGILIGIYVALRGLTAAAAADWLNSSIAAQFCFILLAEALTVGAVLGFLKLARALPRSIGLRRPRIGDVLYGLAAVIPYYLLYLITVGVVSHFVQGLNPNQTQEIGFNNAHGAGELIMTAISLVVLPPIAEEVLVRGLLYSSLKKLIPVAGAVIGTSLLFAAAHLPEGGAAGPLYIAALDTFVLSLVLIYLREKTGGLYASMTLHAIKNGIAFVALFVLHVH